MNFEQLQQYLKITYSYLDGNFYYLVPAANRVKIGQKAGNLNSSGRLQISIKGKLYLVHRLIFLYHHGYMPKFIDHIDRNPLNNNIENLREVTKSENGFNRGKNKNNTSKYKCVTYMKDKKKWKAYIKINGKQKHLGYFMAPELAYEAYCKFVRANLPIHYLGE